ncbi:MAG: putative toxin-antitoxin system toxin component, PIN family [Bacilli bacterium]|nr:putative toxin-antitoxin system toxin component, PIN family [Bacilli bacterium]
MTYYAVVDTNVLVSALLKEGSIPYQIIEYIRSKKIIPLFNEDIITEYIEVLVRNKFGLTEEQVKNTIALFLDHGLEIEPVEIDEFFSHNDDKIFYQIVMSSRQSGEDSKLVTGNIKHFPRKEFVVTPAEMIEIINLDEKLEKEKGTE